MTNLDFLAALESGALRAAYPEGDEWIVNTTVKEGILKLFREGQLENFMGAYRGFVDKDTLPPRAFIKEEGIRMVPGGSSVRRGAFIAKNVIIMPPSYVNIGAYVDEGTMVDSHVLVGSCAQIGKRVHLSAGVQIGGVLEPIGARPVIIEDDAFVGAGVVIVEGVRVCRGAVIAPGVVLSKSIPIFDCVNNRMVEDHVIPENVIVVPGSRPAHPAFAKKHGLHLQCAVIIKERDIGSNAALALESALREQE